MTFYADTGFLLSLHLRESTSVAAAAVVLRCSTLLSFDKRQRALAARAGLKVRPEKTPAAA